jgi:hypothetical protein
MIVTCFALLLGVFGAPLQADTSIFYSGGDGAINGYDPVAYFTAGEPVEGSADIAVMWKGVVWRFSSRAHREAFEADPWAFAPQYGGYCAYGVSIGYRNETRPEAWQIISGKLYLIHTLHVRTIWQRDVDRYIAQANANWPDILHD